jgi:protocatechuate 3,4-dioxygenase beta subunit
MTSQPSDLNRRSFLRLGLAVPASLALVAAGGRVISNFLPSSGSVSAQELPATPECGDNAPMTIAETEGPYFKRSSPERASLLEDGLPGTRLVVSGYVLSRQCQPIQGALLDFWQADDGGNYDNAGYRLRGHQFTDENGQYRLETVVPGLYPGRTRHIHVKVQAPNGPILTTQLYFPNEPRNQRDGIYNAALLMAIQEADSMQWGSFNFVVNLA